MTDANAHNEHSSQTDVAAETAPANELATGPGWTGAVSAPTRFVLLRHGQTPMSIRRQYSGSTSDPELTELGHNQASAAAQWLVSDACPWRIDGIVASPQVRAQQTADHVARALGTRVTTDTDLRETNFGAWEGMTFSEAQKRDPQLHMDWLADPAVAPPEGEAFAVVDKRVGNARDRITNEFGESTILVVSHVTPIKALLRQGLDAGFSLYTRLHLDLASISVAEFYADGPTAVTLVNDTAHLR